MRLRTLLKNMEGWAEVWVALYFHPKWSKKLSIKETDSHLGPHLYHPHHVGNFYRLPIFNSGRSGNQNAYPIYRQSLFVRLSGILELKVQFRFA